MSNVPHDSGSAEDTEIEQTYRKGPWTEEEEDDLLRAYIDKHGDGKWNTVEKNSGLSRSAKSCRLRWVDHLRSDLKRYILTKEEEQRVIELHAKMGNKWSLISKQLPGRTGNEIKNFWNTRLSRLKRLGLPVYPDAAAQAPHSSSAGDKSNIQISSSLNEKSTSSSVLPVCPDAAAQAPHSSSAGEKSNFQNSSSSNEKNTTSFENDGIRQSSR